MTDKKDDPKQVEAEGLSNPIDAYIHCASCAEEAKAKGISSAEYARFEVGIAFGGKFLEVWCTRHDHHVAMFELLESLNPECDECNCPGCRDERGEDPCDCPSCAAERTEEQAIEADTSFRCVKCGKVFPIEAEHYHSSLDHTGDRVCESCHAEIEADPNGRTVH
jgi:hypothetical protein